MKFKLTAERLEIIMRYFFIFLTVIAIVFIIISDDPDDPVAWEQYSGAIITLILFMLPTILARKLKLKLPPILQIVLLLFLFASMYLGEIRGFFYKYSWWDNMLHFWSAMMLGYLGFLLIYTLNKDKDMNLKLSPFFISLFTFCFAMMIGVLWEVFEFLVDEFTGANMQKARYLMYVDGIIQDIRYLSDEVIARIDLSRIAEIMTITSDSLATAQTTNCTNQIVLSAVKDMMNSGYMDTRFGLDDSMIDFIANTLGALLVSLVGYIYCKKRIVKDNAFWRLKDQFIEHNPGLFEK